MRGSELPSVTWSNVFDKAEEIFTVERDSNRRR